MSTSKARFTQQTVGNVPCIVASPDGNYRSDLPTVLMLHGYGADASDLAPLAAQAELNTDTQWIFPEAVKALEFAGFTQGRAWFDIDQAALNQAINTGTYRDLSGSRPPDLDTAVDYLRPLCQALATIQNDVHLGGFSQGAMMSTELTLNKLVPNQKSLIILSGAYLDAGNWQRLAAAREALPFFQSHGTKDPLLDPEAAKRLNKMLSENGWVSNYFEFEGEHTIPPQIFLEMVSFLNGLLAGSKKG